MNFKIKNEGLLLISLFVFLPSFFYVSANASSMAFGIFAVCIVTILSLKIRFFRNAFASKFALILISVLVMQFVMLLFDNPSLKGIASIVFALVMVITAAIMEFYLVKLEGHQIISNFKKLSILIVFLGLASLVFRIQILGYDKFPKSIFPFAEPSHFLISVSAILFFTGFYLNPVWRIILIFSLSLQALLHPSLVMTLLVILMIIFYYLRKPFRFFVLSILMSVIAYLSLKYLGVISYFADRLDFSENSSNLTALIYMQGWEDAFRALMKTDGLGLGFQNMGMMEAGEYGKKIYNILGEYKNRKDAGFLAAKIIGEFGILGVGMIVFYLNQFRRSAMHLFRFMKYKIINSTNEYFETYEIFAHAVIVTFFIELFARGYGYFSPGVFLLLVANFLLSRKKTNLDYV